MYRHRFWNDYLGLLGWNKHGFIGLEPADEHKGGSAFILPLNE